MSARTAAAKRRAKRGRPRLPANQNTLEPNGRRTRRLETMGTPMDVAVSTRIRHLGLVDTKIETAVKQALDPRRGYVLGLLLLDRKITEDQHKAGMRYSEVAASFYGLVVGQFPSVRAQDLFAVRGEATESDGQAKAAQRARAAMLALRDALLATGDIDTGRKVEHAVKQVCLMDIPQARMWPEQMLLLLRNGLNSIAKKYST